MARIVVATYGSLGDLHPALALALGLQARGHRVELATSETYREKIAALGLPFHPLRPDLPPTHLFGEIMDGPRAFARLMRDHLFPAVRTMHADLAPVVAGVDLLIASELVFPASLLAATQGVHWASYTLAPASLFSLHDPSWLPLPGPLHWLNRGGPRTHRAIQRVARIVSHRWWRPVRQLRTEFGLPPGGHPLFEGKYSPRLNLALFSAALQPPQPDWPAQTVQTGFLFHDENSARAPLPATVERFLAEGPAPIVFTLGSAAVHIPGNFYTESARAAQQLGRRALLLLGKNPPPPDLPPSILAWDYLPFAQIFPAAAAIVHQGGVGTTAQSLRAGRPMLIVPFAHDQFDHAARIVRLGAGRTLSRRQYRAGRVARELAFLLDDEYPRLAAAQASRQIQTEAGVENACVAVEQLLGR